MLRTEPKLKTCAWTGCSNQFRPRFKTTEKFCSSECTYKDHKKKQEEKRAKNISKGIKEKTYKIPRQSSKGASITKRYTPLRREYLSRPENEICCIDGGSNCTLKATTIEHTKGRGDYYVDDYAEEHDIPLTLDERFWKPACLNCNLELENNDELSKAHQLSKIHKGKKI